MTVTNKDRAEWAAAALKHFQTLTGTDQADSLADLLCDIHHLCDRDNLSFQTALDRGRQHYDAEFLEDSTTPYMAVFSIPAGTAREIFFANSPEEALQKARKFSDDTNLTEADFDPTTEAYCVREITVSDEHDQQHAVWQTDEYRLQLAAPKLLQTLEQQIEITKQIIDAWNNYDGPRPIVEELIEALQRQSQDASAALDACEIDDLSSAVSDLQEAIAPALELIAQAKGGAA